MRHDRVLLSLLLFVSLLLLSGCDWLFPGVSPPEPPISTKVVSGKVEVPSGSPLSPSDLEVYSIADSARVNGKGSFSLRMPKDLPQVVFVKDTPTQNIVLLGYQVPGNRLVIDAESTALALVMTHPLFMHTTAGQRREIAQRTMTLPGFSQLASDIENLLISDPHNLFSVHLEIYEKAESIAIEALQASMSNAQGMEQDDKAAPLKIGWSTPAPVVKEISADGKEVVFENIALLYYGAGYYDKRSDSELLNVELIERADVFEFRREPPFVFVAQPKLTTHERPVRSTHVIYHKGMFSGRPLDEILNDPPAREAFKANVIDMILEIIDLFVPVKLLLPSPPILAYMIDFESTANEPTLGDLAGNYVSAQRAISLIRTLINDNSDKIITALAKYIERAKVEELVRWLKDLASWIKWPIMAFEILTEKLPYFLDLSGAQVQASYMFMGQLQINSTPSGAKVFLDGEEKAFTTDHLFTLYAGEATIKLTKPGYEDWHGTALVIPNQTITVSATLVPVAGNRPPTATITTPPDGSTFTEGDPITFQGEATDLEDGTLTRSSLVWTSDIDGQIGTGESLTKSDLSVGTHTITLTATDSQGATGAVGIIITISASTPGPGCTVTLSPADSIQETIDRALPGSVICLQAGVWEENLRIQESLTLLGQGPEQTMIKGARGGYPVIWIESDSEIEVSLDGITTAEAPTGGGCGPEEWICPDGITVRGSSAVSITNFTMRDNQDCGLFVRDLATVTLSNSEVYGNGCALATQKSAQVNITDSIFSNNTFGLSVYDSAYASLQNCTISGNGRNGLIVGLSTEGRSSAKVEVRSSIIEGNGTNEECQQTDPYCCVCNGITVGYQSLTTITDSRVTNNTDWGVAAVLERCGYDRDGFTGQVIFRGDNVIEGNYGGDVCLP